MRIGFLAESGGNFSTTRKRANISTARGEVFELIFNSPLFVSEDRLMHYRLTQTFMMSKDVAASRTADGSDCRKPEVLSGRCVSTTCGYGHRLSFSKLTELNYLNHTHLTHCVGPCPCLTCAGATFTQSVSHQSEVCTE